MEITKLIKENAALAASMREYARRINDMQALYVEINRKPKSSARRGLLISLALKQNNASESFEFLNKSYDSDAHKKASVNTRPFVNYVTDLISDLDLYLDRIRFEAENL